MSQTYDNTGKVSMWANPKYEAGGRQPRMKGKIFAHRDYAAGEEIEISLWDNNSENPKAPAMTGKLSDKYVADSGQPMGEPNDSIPF